MVGTFLAYLVNVSARLAGFILRIDHSLEKPVRNIVVCKYAGLGSIIQATPLLQTLRKRFPTAKLIFVSTDGNGALLKHISEIDETLLVSDKSIRSVLVSSVRLLRKLWKLKPDLYFDLEFYSNYSGIMTTLSLATNRFGFYNASKAYRKGIYNFLVPFDADLPISETYLQFSRLVSCEEVITGLKISVPPLSRLEEVLQKLELPHGQKYITINPNASDLRLERRWPKASYVQTISYLLRAYPVYKLVLIGNKAEAAYVAEIVHELPAHTNIVNSAGRLSLPELILLISGAELMLTNDTGPMHMAFALNVKTISLFGPCSPQQYGKMDNAVIFYKKVPCSPCVHKHLTPPCHGDNICMKNILVEEVTQALAKDLS